MSSQRPKRSRKKVDYGEDHLHWVEETQLQKALLRSLHDKDSPHKKLRKENTPNTDESEFLDKTREACDEKLTDVLTDSDSDSEKEIIQKRKNESESSVPRPEDSFGLRLTRLQSKLLEEAGMHDPDDEETKSTRCQSNSKDDETKSTDQSSSGSNSQEKTSRKTLFPNNADTNDTSSKIDSSDPESSSISTRLRAQRKFACNASPPRTRSNSPVKMHRQKVNTCEWNVKETTRGKSRRRWTRTNKPMRAVRASTSESENMDLPRQSKQRSSEKKSNQGQSEKARPPSLFECIPKTDTFLSYLCFRNTSVKVNLHDFKK